MPSLDFQRFKSIEPPMTPKFHLWPSPLKPNKLFNSTWPPWRTPQSWRIPYRLSVSFILLLSDVLIRSVSSSALIVHNAMKTEEKGNEMQLCTLYSLLVAYASFGMLISLLSVCPRTISALEIPRPTLRRHTVGRHSGGRLSVERRPTEPAELRSADTAVDIVSEECRWCAAGVLVRCRRHNKKIRFLRKLSCIMAVPSGGQGGQLPPQSKNHHWRIIETKWIRIWTFWGGMESYDYLWKFTTWVR